MFKPAEICIDKAMRLIARGLAAKRLKTIAHGLENIPAHGPALIAARHYHHLFDGLALFAAIPRRFHIVVTLDWAQSRWTRCCFSTLNQLARWPALLRADALAHRNERAERFTPRDVQRYQRTALKQSIDLLVEGRLLVIFPEGYPNIDPTYTPKTAPDEFLPFKAGFVNIIKAAERRLRRKIPIIPAGLHYSQESRWIVRLRFGTLIYADNHRSKSELIENVQQSVESLSADSG